MTGGPAAAILGLPKLPPGLRREVTIQFVAALIARCCVIATLVAGLPAGCRAQARSEEHTSELQSLAYLVCRLLLEKKKHTSELQSLAYLVCRLLLENKNNTYEAICICAPVISPPH